MNNLLQTIDAREWAKGFMEAVRTNNLSVAEDLMTAWFANAIMAGYDAANRATPCAD